jgi:DNA topoisomerase-1
VLLATDPDREGEAIAWHLAEELKPAPRGRPSASSSTRSPRRASSTASSAPARARQEPLRRPAGTSRAGPDRRLRRLGAGMEQARLRPQRRAGAERRAPAHRRPRARDRGLRSGRVLELRRGAHARDNRRDPPLRRSPDRFARTARSLPSTTPRRPRASGRSRGRRATVVAKVTKSERKRHPPRTVHDQQAPAGCRQPARLRRQAHDADRAGALRGRRPRQGRRPVGLITYMRTDSTRLSPDAVERRARLHRRSATAKANGCPRSRTSSSPRKNAQDAHEAIRPTSLDLPPGSVRKHLKDEQFKLYKLIWERFIASQMTPAVYDQTSVDIEATNQAERTVVRSARQRACPQVQRAGSRRTARASRPRPPLSPARARGRR